MLTELDRVGVGISTDNGTSDNEAIEDRRVTDLAGVRKLPLGRSIPGVLDTGVLDGLLEYDLLGVSPNMLRQRFQAH